MGVGIYGNSEDFIDEFEPSPDNSEEMEPGQDGDDTLGAGPDEGEPEKGQTESPDEEQPSDKPKGEGLILGKFKSYQDLVEAYKNLERRLGQQSQQQHQMPQVPLWNHPPAGAYPPVGMPAAPPPIGGWGMPQAPVWPQAPQATPWMPGTTMTPAQPQAPQSSQDEEQVDPNKWLEEFYEKGPKAIEGIVERRARKLVDEALNQAATTYIAPLAQSLETVNAFVTTEAMRRQFQGMIQAAAHGKEDFHELRDDMEAIIREQPHLMYLATMGANPFEVAYAEAKRRREAAQAQEQQVTAQKKGAQMPRPSAAARRDPQPQDLEKAYVRSIFGLDESGGSKAGIYDQNI